MAVVAKWRTGNTRPAVLIPLDLGTDPSTDTARTLAVDDVVTMIMLNRGGVSPTAQTRTVTVESTDPPVVSWKPEDGDFDESGTYDVVFDITDADTDVETIPNDAATDYQFEIDLKPGDTGYEAGV